MASQRDIAAITENTFSIACRGGLDLTTNTQELLEKPGFATRLINFEPSNDGGYRRISGFTSLGDGPDLNVGKIKGLWLVNDEALILCKEGNVYFTFDMTNYIQINKTMDLVANPNGINQTDLLAAAEIPRDDSDHYSFQTFRQGVKVIVMGNSEGSSPFFFEYTGTTLANTTYIYKELSLTVGSLEGAKFSEKHKDQYVIAGMDSAPSEIFYSDILKPDDFEGANAGSIGFNDTVKGLQMFRGDLYVFCRNSIHRVSGLSSGSPQRIPVTTKIGCINGDSIQELAGDLVFLSPDGLRTLSATDKIGDVNLSSLSESVANRLRLITKQIDKYDVRSETLKSKVQYRLFFNSKPGSNLGNYSVLMHMGFDLNTGRLTPAFSELSGFEISSITNGFYQGAETTVTGDNKGKIWDHDTGIDFDGKQINFLYETPYFSMGDPAVRKNIHELITYLKVEGDTSFNLALKFDYDSTSAYNPAPYRVGPLKAPAIYGLSKYLTNAITYGAEKSPTVRTTTEGSGKTMSIRIFPTGERCDPFSLQGYDVRFIEAGRI